MEIKTTTEERIRILHMALDDVKLVAENIIRDPDLTENISRIGPAKLISLVAEMLHDEMYEKLKAMPPDELEKRLQQSITELRGGQKN